VYVTSERLAELCWPRWFDEWGVAASVHPVSTYYLAEDDLRANGDVVCQEFFRLHSNSARFLSGDRVMTRGQKPLDHPYNHRDCLFALGS
jgi:hypothetical protein